MVDNHVMVPLICEGPNVDEKMKQFLKMIKMIMITIMQFPKLMKLKKTFSMKMPMTKLNHGKCKSGNCIIAISILIYLATIGMAAKGTKTMEDEPQTIQQSLKSS